MVYFVQFDFEIGYGTHFEISNHIRHAVSILNGIFRAIRLWNWIRYALQRRVFDIPSSFFMTSAYTLPASFRRHRSIFWSTLNSWTDAFGDGNVRQLSGLLASCVKYTHVHWHLPTTYLHIPESCQDERGEIVDEPCAHEGEFQL